MKTLLENLTSRKLSADHVIKAVLLDVGSPPPSEPDKQPIVLCLPPGDIKMGCNLIGKHLHIDPAEKGKAIWITSKKEGACYVSYFPDEKKHFLTIRDGVKFDFRDLDPKTKMHNPKDRLPYLADHFRVCYDEAMRAMEHARFFPGAPPDAVAIATVLWLETKAGVVVPPVPMSEPKGEKLKPEPDKSPDKSEPEVKPEPEGEKVEPIKDPMPEAAKLANEERIQKYYTNYAEYNYSRLCEMARKAFVYAGEDETVPLKKEALTRLLDTITANKDPKAWADVYDEIWQPASESVQKAMDDCVAMCFEKKPNITPSAAHKIACLSYLELTKSAEEKI